MEAEGMERVPNVLVVGATCLDIINFCDGYPTEDSDYRAELQVWQKGGNAANTSEVLSQLHVKPWIMSNIGMKHLSGKFLLDELRNCGVDSSLCRLQDMYGSPTSNCVVNNNNGSRTIVHCRNGLPELTYSDFDAVDLSLFDWIHMEGRGFPDVLEMLNRASEFKNSHVSDSQLRILSFELEKPRFLSKSIAGSVLKSADIVFVSKDVARCFGFSDAKSAVRNLKNVLNVTEAKSAIICLWGEHGCDAVDAAGCHYHADAVPITNIVDTLGAGDTFIAAFISKLLKNTTIFDAMKFACKLASIKCSQRGFKTLAL